MSNLSRKALPVKLSDTTGYIECGIEEATHITLNIPGPTGMLTLPVITKGTRDGTNYWSWNGDIYKPTIKPSVLTQHHLFTCHSFINDGKVQFLSDCSHDLVNQTLDLKDI